MSKIFVPRTVPPQIGEKWWDIKYNKCLSISNGTVLPNCVGYAYGRFAEILGEFHPDLPMCNAGMWLDELKKKTSSLKWGTTPKLGAVAVWKEPGAYGHVGVVEYIYEDGSLMLSESGYGSGWNKRFWNSGPRVAPNWYGSPYQFQGFIYNPGTEDVENVAPYTGGIRYGTDLSNNNSKYADQVSTYSKSVSSTNFTTPTTNVASSRSSTYQSNTVQLAPTQASYTSQNYGSDASIKNFINAIMAHNGKSSDGLDWVKSKTYTTLTKGWSAAMICAAGIETNQSDIIPKNVFAYNELGQTIVEDLGGEYFLGAKNNGLQKPQVGDIFAVYTGTSPTQYSATILGVVIEVGSDSIQTVEGDFGKTIRTQTRRLLDVSWYVRPDWTRTAKLPIYSYEDVTTSRTEAEPVVGPPQVDYFKDQTKNDATLREVTYLTEGVKPSITSTGIKLSAINYSGLLGKVYDVMGLSNVQYPDEDNARSYNFNGSYFISSSKDLQGSPQIIFEFLYNKNLSVSKVIGFMANIEAESSFRTNAVNQSSGASGICQWIGDRKSSMIKYCGSDWKNNLTGQLEFLWSELQSSEQRTLTALLAVEGNNQSSAEQAAEIVCRQYERPSNIESAVKTRRDIASKLWSQLGASYTSTLTEQSIVTTNKGNSYVKGSIIEVPTNIPNRQITSKFSSYEDRSKTYSKDSVSYKLSEIWTTRNKPSKYYVATIDGYFLVAVSSKFGSAGDVVSIVLDNGTYINAIIAENKGSGYYVDSLQSDILEWMSSGKDKLSIEVGLRQSSWINKIIIKSINYGSWFS